MKNLRIAAFVVVTVCAFCLPALGQGTQWGLKRISVNNRLTRFAKITREHYDASGGTVEITVDGKTLGGACPGGSEVLRFKWHFAGDISRVSNGGSLSVNLEADRSLNRPCNGSIAELSYIYISGGEPAPANGQFEVDRFLRIKNGTAWAGRDPKQGMGSVGVGTKGPTPGRPIAPFVITIGARGGGEVAYVYEYERGGQSSGGGNNTSLPRAVRECEAYQGTICGNWTLNGNQFIAKWDNGASATLTVERFDNGGVVITRRDSNSDFTARYTGRKSGNKVEGGTVTWTSRGQSWSGRWSASW